jgi:hypothetical protein
LQKSVLVLAPLGSAGANVPGYNNYRESVQLSPRSYRENRGVDVHIPCKELGCRNKGEMKCKKKKASF